MDWERKIVKKNVEEEHRTFIAFGKKQNNFQIKAPQNLVVWPRLMTFAS